MTGYTIQRLDSDPIIIVKYLAEFMPEDAGVVFDECKALLDQSQEPQIVIADLADYRFRSLDEFVQAANLTARQRDILHHPMSAKTLFVSQDRLIILGAKGLNTVTFGNIEVTVYPSQEDALQAAREWLAAR